MLNQGDIIGTYQILSVIGRGGFGIVYKGRHQELGIEVAIKEYFPSELCIRHGQSVQPSKPEYQASFEESLDRFIREAKQLENFRDSPNIVTCRDLFRANGTAYIVMDYVAGIPLSLLLERREARGGPFTEQDLLHVIIPLLMGLQTVHESGVYHRDIKPSNILIRRADRVPILIDFGAAKHQISRYTKSFAPYSDGYAAMEQIGEGEIGPWTDIYGVGAVMWRMVAGGAPPFSPPSPIPVQRRAFELMQGQADPLPSAIGTGRHRFSPSVLQAIDDCLMINVSDRVQSCTEILERLAPTLQADVQNSKLEQRTHSSKTPELSQTSTKNGESRTAAQTDLLRTGRSKRKSKHAVLLSLVLIGLLTFVVILTQTRPEINSSLQQILGGDAEAQYNRGYTYYTGEGVPQNIQEAFKLFRLAANQGNTDAQRMLGEMYYRGEGMPLNFGEAIKWFRLAADQGDAKAQAWLGHMYYRGRGIPEDMREGDRLYQLAYDSLRIASEQGDADAQGLLGYMYFNGEGIPENGEEGARLYRLAADQGLAWVQRNLGIRYYLGNSVPKDDQEAIKLFRLAAGQGDAGAQQMLGIMYYGGHGVPENDREAVKWSRLAAEQGHASAQSDLGYAYYNGTGVSQDFREAVKWFRLAAEQENTHAQVMLGTMYYRGEGVSTDFGEAIKWFRLAVDQGDAGAQAWLGHMYSTGEGVPKDSFEAAKWFRLSADQGNAASQFLLGRMYYNGEGIPQNFQEAAKWFQLAAEQENAQAQSSLGYMYANGEGVPRDYVIAYAWYNIAIANGAGHAEASRDEIQSVLTPTQREQAQKLSTEIYNRIQSSKAQ